MQDTPLIILDEPTTHFNLLHKVVLFKLLNSPGNSKKWFILHSRYRHGGYKQLSDEMIIMTLKI
jgi:iron complex transport system ATP-binding protein